MDRSLIYRRQLESLRKKLTSHVALLRRLANSHLNPGPFNSCALGIAKPGGLCSPKFLEFLVVLCLERRFTKKYCSSLSQNIWPRKALGWLRHCTALLPGAAGIQSAELCRKGATLSLAHRTMVPGHLFHSVLTCPPSIFLKTG